MKFLVVVASLALAVSAELPVNINRYHDDIGVPEAARIKRMEEAQDFDGSRIIGGQISALGAHPYLGGILIALVDGRTSLCGSSLLTNTRLVTAAHCWRTERTQARQFTVVLGSTNIYFGGVRRTTTNVQLHANYNQRNANNDVAIVTINHVAYTNAIQPIAIATGNNNYTGVTATAAGFGRISDSNNVQNEVKRHVNLQVITNAVCARTFGGNIISSTLCTSGAEGRSTCFGDSGGPLVIGSGSNRRLIGITSFGAQYCTIGAPAAFARVTSFASWINARI